jgi:hypothetical protein
MRGKKTALAIVALILLAGGALNFLVPDSDSLDPSELLHARLTQIPDQASDSVVK